jgi:phage-related protein
VDFEVELYRAANGFSPVEAFLRDLADEDLKEYHLLAKGLLRLKQRANHREPFSKALGAGLFELRHQHSLNARILWFFVKGRRIIAVHGIRHKAQAIHNTDIQVARERMADWLRRHP